MIDAPLWGRLEALGLFILFVLTPVLVAGSERSDSHTPVFRLDLPLVEVPFNVEHGYGVPSMKQALGLTAAVDEALFVGYDTVTRAFPLFDSPFWNSFVYLPLFAVGYAVFYDLPFSDLWLHETFHQAVLQVHGIESYNDVYNLSFASLTSVSHIADADLIRLKAESNPDLIRAHVAGPEAQVLLADRLLEDEFFSSNRTSPYVRISAFLNLFAVSAYLWSCTDTTGQATDRANRVEKDTVEVRDLSGLDFTAWVYDLYHPTESYSARGTHPYGGLGVDRYVAPSDLNDGELSYLVLQSQLSLLSFLDWAYWTGGALAFPGSQDARWNVNARYYPTSFGSSVQVNLLYRDADVKLRISPTWFANHDAAFPGLSIRLDDIGIPAVDPGLRLGGGLNLWRQPRGQAFQTVEGDWGGSIQARLEWLAPGNLGFSVEGEVKTAGWMAGNEYLSPHVGLAGGIHWLP